MRFENQNITWTFEDLDRHSNAFAYGLVEQGWKSGDRLLLWIGNNHTSEICAAQIGAAKAGVTIVAASTGSEQDIEKLIGDSQCTGILFSPNTKIGETKYSEIIRKLVPETAKTNRGAEWKSSKYPKLRHIIHTGFYSQPGTIKYKQLLLYASKNYNTVKLPEFNASNPLLIGSGKGESYTLKDLSSD